MTSEPLSIRRPYTEQWWWTGTARQAVSALEMTPTDDQPRDSAAPADVDHDNLRKAKFAGRALGTYIVVTKPHMEEPLPHVVSDLVADLQHLCREFGVDFDAEVLDQARERFREEITGRM